VKGAGLRKPPLVCGRSMVVVAKGSNWSNSTEAVRDEVLAGSATGHVGDRGERGGLGGAVLKLSCDFVMPLGRSVGVRDFLLGARDLLEESR
jgi:hypothetical protein